MPAAARRMRAANDEFLGAVKSVAKTSSKHVREELDSLVARAKRTAPKLTGSMRKAADAADGRLMELPGETARAGVRAAQRGVGTLAMGASGLLEGLADVVSPRGRAAASPARADTKRTVRRKKKVKKRRKSAARRAG